MKTVPFVSVLALCAGLCSSHLHGAEPLTMNVWPGKPPSETKDLPPEADQTKPDDRLIAGRRIIKLGNVSTPQLAIYRPAKEKDTGAAVVICPGGGHYILAYDLEGTEVAEWLNEIGVTGIVLKYRVPFRDPEKRWLSGVQDGQRAMSLVRSKAAEWDWIRNGSGCWDSQPVAKWPAWFPYCTKNASTNHRTTWTRSRAVRTSPC